MFPKFITAALLLAMALPATAELGGQPSLAAITSNASQIKSKAMTRDDQTALYTVNELQTGQGISVREFLTPAGIVFAVAWEGSGIPNLRTLFGEEYFDRYVEAASNRRSRGPIQVQQPGLVVQSGGHMRSFNGRAYIPELVPADVSLAIIE